MSSKDAVLTIIGIVGILLVFGTGNAVESNLITIASAVPRMIVGFVLIAIGTISSEG